jgi:paraquat-inducible protein B
MASRPAIVGAFILGALVLGVAATLFFGGMRLFAESSRVVVFFSESVAGLDIGSPVTFHGVRIGSVQSVAVRFSTDTLTARIPVYLELRPNQFIWEGRKLGTSGSDYEQLVRTGLRAQLALQSFVTGQMRVDLDFRPDTPIQRVGTIAGVPEIPAISSDLSQLRNQLTGLPLHELADSAQQAFVSVRRLADHLDAEIDPLTERALRTMDVGTQTLQSAELAVRNVQADASTALREADLLFVDARRQLAGRGEELSRTLKAGDRGLRQAEAFLTTLNGLVEPGSQLRGNVEATLRDLAASAGSLRDFASTIERDPNALLIGRSRR